MIIVIVRSITSACIAIAITITTTITIAITLSIIAIAITTKLSEQTFLLSVDNWNIIENNIHILNFIHRKLDHEVLEEILVGLLCTGHNQVDICLTHQIHSIGNKTDTSISDTLTVEKNATAVFDTLDGQAAHLHADGAVRANAASFTSGTATFNGSAALTSAVVDDESAEVSFNGQTQIGGSSEEFDLIINRGTVNINGELTVNGKAKLGNNRAGAAKSFITIGKDGVLTAEELNGAWGFNTMTVDGVADTAYFNLSSGTTQEIKGSGTINATKLTGGNAGTYHFTGVRLNIGAGGIDGSREILLRDVTLGALDSWTADRDFSLDGVVTVDTEKVNRATSEHTGEGAALVLNGALSGKNAALVKDGKGTLTLGGNNSHAAGTLVKEGTLIAAHTSALGTGVVEVRKEATLQLGAAAVTAADVTLAESRVERATDIANAELTINSLTVRNGGSIGDGVQLKAQNGAGAVSLSAEGEGDAAISGSLQLTKSNEENHLTMTGRNGTKLHNTKVHLAAETVLHVSDVILGAGSRITDDTAEIVVHNVVFEVSEDMNVKLTEAELPLTLSDAPLQALPNGTLTLTNVEDVTLTGYHLTIDLSGISKDALSRYGVLGITLGEGANAASFSEHLDVSVSYDDATTDTFYAGEDYGTVYFLVRNLVVPEPATATLSLLALAALAARRRRTEI